MEICKDSINFTNFHSHRDKQMFLPQTLVQISSHHQPSTVPRDVQMLLLVLEDIEPFQK